MIYKLLNNCKNFVSNISATLTCNKLHNYMPNHLEPGRHYGYRQHGKILASEPCLGLRTASEWGSENSTNVEII